MIKTVIEVQGKDDFEFGRNLEAALSRLGFEPKLDASNVKWREDLFRALAKNGINPSDLVSTYRKAEGFGGDVLN